MRKILILISLLLLGTAVADDTVFLAVLKDLAAENSKAARAGNPAEAPAERLVQEWKAPATRAQVQKTYFPVLERGAFLLFDPGTVALSHSWNGIRHILPAYKAWALKNSARVPREARYLLLLHEQKYDEIELALIDALQTGRSDFKLNLLGTATGIHRESELFDDCLNAAFKENPGKTVCAMFDFADLLGWHNFKLNDKFRKLLESDPASLKQLPQPRQFFLLNDLINEAAAANGYQEKKTLQELNNNSLYKELAALFPGMLIEVVKEGQSSSSSGKPVRNKKAPLKVTIKNKG